MFKSKNRDDYAADREHVLEYILASGIVADLHICEGYVGSGFLKSDEKHPGGAPAVALALGREDEPYSGGEMRMQYFTCRVDGHIVVGYFGQVSFKEGDLIEFAVHKYCEKIWAPAARDPLKRYIWVQPYMTRGAVAQKHYDIYWGVATSIVPSFLIGAYETYDGGGELFAAAPWFGPAVGGMLLFILATMNFFIRWQFYPPSLEATQIFLALGFAAPEHVNLKKGDKLARKQRPKAPAEHYSIASDPLCFRY